MIIKKVILVLITGYRVAISPLLGNNCRFNPSCSSYTEQAIERHGVCCGGYLGLKRLLRCHPFHPGGYDPVPEHKKTLHDKHHTRSSTLPISK